MMKNGSHRVRSILIEDYQRRRRPVPQMTLQSDRFPAVPERDPTNSERETHRDSVLSSPAASAIPLEAHFVQEPLRSSPEPVHPNRNSLQELNQASVNDDSIAIIADFLRRNEGADPLRKVREYLQGTPSIYSSDRPESITNESSTLHRSPHSSSHTGSSSERTVRPRQPTLVSIPETNGSDVWGHVEPLSSPSRSDHSGHWQQTTGDLIGACPSYLTLINRSV